MNVSISLKNCHRWSKKGLVYLMQIQVYLSDVYVRQTFIAKHSGFLGSQETGRQHDLAVFEVWDLTDVAVGPHFSGHPTLHDKDGIVIVRNSIFFGARRSNPHLPGFSSNFVFGIFIYYVDDVWWITFSKSSAICTKELGSLEPANEGRKYIDPQPLSLFLSMFLLYEYACTIRIYHYDIQ